MQHGGEPFFGAFFAPPAIPSVVTFRAALALSTAHISLSSLLVLLMQYGGEPFFGASFAPPAMPSVVSFTLSAPSKLYCSNVADVPEYGFKRERFYSL